jgi:hypothetical protein
MPEKKPDVREPVKYTVKEPSLVGNEIHPAGAVVEYAGLPAENLEPMCDVGRERHQEYLDLNAERVKRMINENTVSAVGDPQVFAASLTKAMQANRAEEHSEMAQMIAAAVASALAGVFPQGVNKPAVSTLSLNKT